MTFLHKLANRLALMKDRPSQAAATLPPVAARYSSFAVRWAHQPDLRTTIMPLRNTRSRRSTRLVPIAVCALLALVACEKPIPTGPNGPPVASVVLSPLTFTLVAGATQQLTATPEDSSHRPLTGRQVTWASNNTAMATVDGKGMVAAVAPGQARITATSESQSASASVTILPVPVASVAVTPASPAVQQGLTVQLTATPKDANGNPLSGRVVTWASGNVAYATVDANGLVTGVWVGTTTITATSEGQSGSANVTVLPVPVASVAVTPATATVQQGLTVQLTATPKDANGNPLSGRVVTWASTNTAVAAVSTSGLVTGASPGNATITASSEGQNGTSVITVTTVPVASVSVSPSSGNVPVGGTLQLTATPKDASGAPLQGRVVTWGSSNTAVATVDNTGLVTGVAAGSVTITATSEAQSGTSALTVATVPVASVSVSPTSGTVPVGGTLQLTATPKDALGNPLTGRVVTWATSNSAFATVSTSGLVTGVAAGAVTITATSEGQSGTSALTVATVPVASVSVSPSSGSVPVNGTLQLTATPKDALGNPLTGRVVTWATSNAAVATVGTSGLVTGVAGGSVTITATSEGQNGTATITVNVPVASVAVSPSSGSVQQGSTLQLTATPKDALGNPLTGRVVTWASGNTAVATVDGNGLVTGVGAGSATITATSEGQSGSATITVTLVPVASVTVSPTPASVAAGSTLQLTATPKDALGNPLSGRVVTWATSNAAFATVSSGGLVTGVAAGAVTITATSEGQSGTAAITVTAAGTGPQFDHVFVVMEENNDYLSVTSSSMPYLTGLAAQYGLATQYYANTHPSIGNYLQLTTGQIITNDDSYSGPSLTVDNVVRELLAAGKTWKAYAEDLPSVGFVTMGVEVSGYAARHNPVVYLSDVHDNPTQANNVVPFTQLATDLAANALPNWAMVVPNLCNDAHDCSLNVADTWLQTNIDPLVKSTVCQQSNCLILFLFDESGGDNTNGGGRVYWVAVSPTKSKRAYQSTTLYQHEATLRLTLKGLGVTVFPGAAATAPDMSEFFNP
jgi:uncharacterized protein YjdB